MAATKLVCARNLSYKESIMIRIRTDVLFLKHESRILRQSSNTVCGFSMMGQLRLCAVWPTKNWLDSSRNHIQGWMSVRESYYHALEKRHLDTDHGSALTKLWNNPVQIPKIEQTPLRHQPD